MKTLKVANWFLDENAGSPFLGFRVWGFNPLSSKMPPTFSFKCGKRSSGCFLLYGPIARSGVFCPAKRTFLGVSKALSERAKPALSPPIYTNLFLCLEALRMLPLNPTIPVQWFTHMHLDFILTPVQYRWDCSIKEHLHPSEPQRILLYTFTDFKREHNNGTFL